MSATPGRARRALNVLAVQSRDPMVRNSWLIVATMVLMAGAGSLFWVIAARLHGPAEVGLAGSLVTTAEALAVFSMLGLNITLVRVLPTSRHQAGDITVSSLVVFVAGAALGFTYASLLPWISPTLHEVLGGPLAWLLFALLTGATALNQLTDGIFLGLNKLSYNLRINGVLMGIVKCSLPFALVGAGALGLYASVGAAGAFAGVLSLVVVLLSLRQPPSLRASSELRDARRFAGAGYLSNVLYFLPQLVFPVLMINAAGPRESGLYFIAFQIVTLLNAIVYAACNAMYADAERSPHRRVATIARGGRLAAVYVAVGVVGLWLVSPLLLQVFGSEYARDGRLTLHVLTLGSVGVALNYWSAMRLRVAHHYRAMVGVQLATTTVMIAGAAVLAPFGAVWVAVAWGVGQLFGGILGYTVSRRWAPIQDAEVVPEALIGEEARP